MAEGIGQKLIDLMIDRHITISTAESCTGGMLAAHIVDIPGASRVFHEGYITYNDDAKIHVLNVSKKTIAKCFKKRLNDIGYNSNRKQERYVKYYFT